MRICTGFLISPGQLFLCLHEKTGPGERPAKENPSRRCKASRSKLDFESGWDSEMRGGGEQLLGIHCGGVVTDVLQPLSTPCMSIWGPFSKGALSPTEPLCDTAWPILSRRSLLT